MSLFLVWGKKVLSPKRESVQGELIRLFFLPAEHIDVDIILQFCFKL